MKAVTYALTYLLAAPSLLLAQSASFEVASIRPNNSNSQTISGTYGIRRGGLLSVRNVTLLDLIYLAYSVRPYQVTGGPAWLSTLRFDIQAQPNSPTTDRDARQMLQTLLQDRFALQLHRATKQVWGYTMHLPRGTAKLRTSTSPDPESGFQIMSTQEMRGESVNMPMLAHALAETLSSPVDDRTGTRGTYNMAFQWTPDSQLAAGQPGVSLFTVLWDELGLRLKANRVPVEVLVIRHANRVPTPN